MSDQAAGVPRIGDPAPAFTAQTTLGPLSFPTDLRGKWVVLFSYAADFSPVCATEVLAFARACPAFREANCELIGLSADGIYAHIAWVRRLEELSESRGGHVSVAFPIIADLAGAVARLYGMIHPHSSATQAAGSTFIIDPSGVVRVIAHCPPGIGRSVVEIQRLLAALQHAEEYDIATPADWHLGEDVVVPAPKTVDLAQECTEGLDGYECADWFLCFKTCPHGSPPRLGPLEARTRDTSAEWPCAGRASVDAAGGAAVESVPL